ncbi:MAG: AsmA-like C-terminal region-containing protein, partial [Parvularculaceae bacterium]
SEEKLDFSGLNNIDADLEIAADKIFLNDLEFGQSRLSLEVEDGRMTADIPELDLYGGGGSGQLVVNARAATPTISGKFDISSVDAQPFSLDLMKTDQILGLGGLKIDFTASGASQAAIMRSLDGSGGFDVADGALKGINLVKLVNAVEAIYQGGINPTAISAAIATAQRPDDKTDFSELLSQFSIEDGLVTAPTISLNGPYLTLTGVGDVNLPGQTLDFRLAPRVTSTIDGEGGTSFTIPLRVTGTFSKPKPEIDLAALVQGKGEQFLRGVFEGFGKKEESATGTEGATKEGAALKVLEGVLGGAKPAADTQSGDANETTGANAAPTLKDAIAEEALNQL